MTTAQTEKDTPKAGPAWIDGQGRPRVLLVYKKSLKKLSLERNNKRIQALLEAGDVSVAQLEDAHAAHQAALEGVKSILNRLGAHCRKVYRARLAPDAARDHLVVTVGGDGTLLDASHRVGQGPILGVNSDPDRSVGFLCAARVETLGDQLESIFAQKLQPELVTRLGGQVDGKDLPFPVLNEVLIAHRNPAATCRYLVGPDGLAEDQKSSGLWVGAPAGSTGALASAGGSLQDLADPQLQYRAREPYYAHGDALRYPAGFVRAPEILQVISKMREGRIYLDGAHHHIPFPTGSRLVVHAGGEKLHLFVNDDMKARRREVFDRTRLLQVRDLHGATDRMGEEESR
jgi:NAD+ kinase